MTRTVSYTCPHCGTCRAGDLTILRRCRCGSCGQLVYFDDQGVPSPVPPPLAEPLALFDALAVAFVIALLLATAAWLALQAWESPP